MISYTVRCAFTGESEVAREWLAWLCDEHIQDVIEAGAVGAEIVQMDGAEPTYEIRYRFPSRQMFDTYLAEHAPRLRDEGLSRFPIELGLSYSRTVGEVTDRFPR